MLTCTDGYIHILVYIPCKLGQNVLVVCLPMSVSWTAMKDEVAHKHQSSAWTAMKDEVAHKHQSSAWSAMKDEVAHKHQSSAENLYYAFSEITLYNLV